MPWNAIGIVFTSKMMIANFTFSFQGTFWNASPSTTLKMSPSPQVGLEPLMAMEKLGDNFAVQIKFQVNRKFYNFGKKILIFSRWGLPGIGYLVRGENRPRLLEVKGSRYNYKNGLILPTGQWYAPSAVMEPECSQNGARM